MIFNRNVVGTLLIALVAVASVVALLYSGRIPQDPTYHNFSDSKTYFSVPNALNVLSNIPFILVGFYGVFSLMWGKLTSSTLIKSNELAYWVLFLGTAFVGFGSSYYHLSPSNETLVWDRLPMTIAFMSLYSIIICEFVSVKYCRATLIFLLMSGTISVLYWWYTESHGVGDLRYYIVVQFFPVITIPIILLFFRSKFTLVSAYWVLLLLYVLAKLVEYFDHQIHGALSVLSGHSIKHIFPAIGILYLLHAYKTRKIV